MAIGSLAGVIPRLRGVALVSHGTMSDAELLDRFVSRRDEMAFEMIVRRHGPMVFAVCRRVLKHAHDAEDAFQATFLVLAHKAATVSPRNKLAGFLHGVAHRTALKARHRAARRSEVEKKVPARGQDEMQPDTNWDEVEPLLDQELAGLPERYRLPIILCDLEGRLRSEVASTLGCSEGTLSSRLTRGRRLLADRLKRRGVRVSGAALALVLAERSMVLAEPLIRATVPAALSSVFASAVGCAVSPSVANLATGVMKSMFLKKLQTFAVATFVAFAVGALTLTSLVAERSEAAPAPTAPVPADAKGGDELPPDLNGRLLMNRKVIKDLKCDMDQFDRIMDLLEAAEKKGVEKTNEAMGQIKFNGANVNPAAIDQMFKDAIAEGEKEFHKVVGTATATLTPAQRNRLRQIDLQARGPAAFTVPSVVKALELSPKQKEQLEANIKQTEDELVQANQRPAAALAPGGIRVNGVNGGAVVGGNVVINGAAQFDFEKVSQDVRAEGMKRAMAVLTEEQATGWKKLIGEPVTYAFGNLKGPRSGSGGFRIGGGGMMVPGAQAIPAQGFPVPIVPVQGVPIKP